MSVEEIERVVAQRVANAIEAIAMYETKTNLARKSMSQTKQQEEEVAGNASNKRKWESNHNGSLSQQNKGHKVPRAHTAWPINKKAHAGSLPLCNQCKFHHSGPCTVKCGDYKKTFKIKKRPDSCVLMERLPTVACLLAYVMHQARSKGVTRRLAIAYHPQTSGQVEVSNRGLKRILERTVGENCASWSDKLDGTLWAFRTAFKTPIGCTSYNLVYEKGCHLPIELEHKAYWALKHVNFDLLTAGDHRKVQLNELNELRDQAYENSLIYKEKTKRIHDSKIKDRVFNIGDRVLLFNSRLKILSGKLKTHWTGPFTITQVFPYDIVELS
nr:reverse transcriptase domain-containing protein [Tanacetum cinerariifolium]